MSVSPAPTRAVLAGRAAFAVAMTALLVLLVPASASATNLISCSGGVKLAEERPRTSDMNYQFRCNEPITGFSIATNRQVAGFEPEVLVTTGPNGTPVDGESFGCEGSIPGVGFSCAGESSANKLVLGAFAGATSACTRRGVAPIAMVIVADSEGRISEPFLLKSPRCPKPKPRRRAGGDNPRS